MPQQRLTHFKTRAELERSITPLFAEQGEVIPWTWFDTQTYTSAASTQLDFFQTVQSDKTLGNMQAAGQMPNPMYFDIYHLGFQFNLAPSVVAAGAALTQPGAVNDAHGLSLGAVSLQIAQKSYWESKIFMCPSGSFLVASMAAAGPAGGATQVQIKEYAQNAGDPRKRNNFWGGITIPPNQNFLVRCNWSAALTLQGGNTGIVCQLDGYLYRRVL